MLRSKYFWIAMLILVPFIVVWAMYGIAWAFGMLVMLGILLLFVSGGTRRRRRRVYRVIEDDYDDEEDDVMIVEREPRRRSEHSEWVRDLYMPRGLRSIHQNGLDALGRRQRDDLNRSLRRLRRL